MMRVGSNRDDVRPEMLEEVESGCWIDNEVLGCRFQDVRHCKRLRQQLEQLSAKVGATTPWACRYWADTKAAYRFFGNDQISEEQILAGHFTSTRDRFSASGDAPVLILHDTTEFSYRHEETAPIYILKKIPCGGGKDGRPRFHTSCGILMHSSLVSATEVVEIIRATHARILKDRHKSRGSTRPRKQPDLVNPALSHWKVHLSASLPYWT
jgi:hypothetical protein